MRGQEQDTILEYNENEFVAQHLADYDINAKVEGSKVHVHKDNVTKAKKIVSKLGTGHTVHGTLKEQTKIDYRSFVAWLNEAKKCVKEEDDEDEECDCSGKKTKNKIVMHDGDEDGTRVTEELKGNQHKLDKNKNGKLDAHDFKLLRKEEVELEEADQKIKVTDVKSALKNVKNASSHTKKMIKANPTQKMPYDSSRHAAYSEEFELDEAFKPGDKVTYETSKYSKDNKGVVHSVDGEHVTIKGHDMLGKPHHIEVHQGFVKKLKEDVELDEAIKLNSKVVIHDPGESHHGKVGYVGEIRHGAYKGAPKTYTVDYDHNEETGRAKSIQLDKKNIKQVKESVELDEANFAATMKKAIAAHERGDHERAKYHLDNAKTARYAMKSTEITKHKDLLDKYKELRDMHESVELDEGQKAKTATGYVHKGSYGSDYDTDEEGSEKKKAAPEVKRGRGRPKKGADETGEVKKYTFHDLLNRLSR